MSDVPGRTYFSRLSDQTGFKSDALEKVYRLMIILGRIQDVPELSENLALKGGTAIQGLIFGFKRLSVDIDLNYIGNIEKAPMQQDREEIRRTLLLLFKDLGTWPTGRCRCTLKNSSTSTSRTVEVGRTGSSWKSTILSGFQSLGPSRRRARTPFDDLGAVDALSYRPENSLQENARIDSKGTPRDVYDADLIARSAHTWTRTCSEKPLCSTYRCTVMLDT